MRGMGLVGRYYDRRFGVVKPVKQEGTGYTIAGARALLKSFAGLKGGPREIAWR